MIQRPMDFSKPICHRLRGSHASLGRSIIGLAATSSVSPVSVFPQSVEYALDVAADDADARKPLWPVMFGDEQQRLHRRLPTLGVVFYL
jgi:hypothetical protein